MLKRTRLKSKKERKNKNRDGFEVAATIVDELCGLMQLIRVDIYLSMSSISLLCLCISKSFSPLSIRVRLTKRK